MMLTSLLATEPDLQTPILFTMLALIALYLIFSRIPVKPERPKLKPRRRVKPAPSPVPFLFWKTKEKPVPTEHDKVAKIEALINDHFKGSRLVCANSFYEDGILRHEIHLDGQVKYIGAAFDELPEGDAADGYAADIYSQLIWYFNGKDDVRHSNR